MKKPDLDALRSKAELQGNISYDEFYPVYLYAKHLEMVMLSLKSTLDLGFSPINEGGTSFE